MRIRIAGHLGEPCMLIHKLAASSDGDSQDLQEDLQPLQFLPCLFRIPA